MRGRSSRRRVVTAAAVATAITAVLVSSAATTAAPQPSFAVLRAKVLDAIADEKRALELLKKKPPRTKTAKLALERSAERLREVAGSGPLPTGVAGSLNSAADWDLQAARELGPDRPPGSYAAEAAIRAAELGTEAALDQKAVVASMLQQPAAAQGPQCADRIDNDGDGLIDARHDSGCASKSDVGERSALTCSLGYTAGTTTSVVQGTCTGPFAKLELTAPVGVAFDTGARPTVQHADACHYTTPRTLECAMSDGVVNPRHVVSARFRFRQRSVSAPRVFVRDFARRGRAWRAARAQAQAPAGYLRFRLSYTHEGLSHVCASIEADSGALLKVSIEGPNGYTASGMLQLKKKATRTAPGGFSFRIFEFGSYKVTIVSTAGGKSVTKSQTIAVTGAPGDSRCSATGAPPP